MSLKTLAIRLEPELHARVTILARLTNVSVAEVIRRAIETEVAQLATNPQIMAKATDLQTAITREADEQEQ
jgi:predicted transcriptional regulator